MQLATTDKLNWKSKPFLVSAELFILKSVLRQVYNLFQSEFSTECDLMLPLSISNILQFPSGHPVAAYVLSLSLLLVTAIHPSNPSIKYSEWQILRKIWPFQVALFRLYLLGYSSPLLVTAIHPSNPSIKYSEWQILRKIWPFQVALFRLYLLGYSSPRLQDNTSSLTRSVQLPFSVLLQHLVAIPFGYSWPTFRSVQFSAPHKEILLEITKQCLQQ